MIYKVGKSKTAPVVSESAQLCERRRVTGYVRVRKCICVHSIYLHGYSSCLCNTGLLGAWDDAEEGKKTGRRERIVTGITEGGGERHGVRDLKSNSLPQH